MRRKLRALAAAIRGARGVDARNDVPYGWFTPAEVGAYLEATDGRDEFATVDAQTYRDLNGPSYAARLLGRSSIFARQYFEQRLRCGARPGEAREFADGVVALLRDPAACEAVRHALRPLRQVRQEVGSLLFSAAGSALPAVFARLRHADFAGLAAWTLVVAWPSILSFVLLGAYACFVVHAQIKWYAALKLWTTRRDALQRLVRVAQALASHRSAIPGHLLGAPLQDRPMLDDVAGRIRGGLWSRSSITADYANLLFLYEYAHAHRESQAVAQSLPALGDVFQAVARIELQLAVAEAVQAGLPFCTPRPSVDGSLAFAALVHPLVPAPAPLSVRTSGKSLFISGQNGVGKSTLLRAVGLGLMTHRAFGYAHAQEATLPAAAVWSSVQTDDSVEEARSLYMSELRRAARLLEAARSGVPVVVLVDELFRGTNYVESVSASAAALAELAHANLVLAASHNVVLATLLQGRFDALRIVRGGPVALALEPGVIAETNGVELMSSHGIDEDLVARAPAVARWYAEYIAHPQDVPPQLLCRAPDRPPGRG